MRTFNWKCAEGDSIASIPATKKCAHVLKMMLNYLKFYEMSKKEICARAQTKLGEYNRVLSEKNDLETKIETSKQRREKIDRELAQFEKRLIKLKEKTRVLTEQERELNEMRTKQLVELKSVETQIINLEIKDNELQEKLVADDEYERCFNNYQLYRNQLDEQKKKELHEKAAATKISIESVEREEVLRRLELIAPNWAELEDLRYADNLKNRRNK